MTRKDSIKLSSTAYQTNRVSLKQGIAILIAFAGLSMLVISLMWVNDRSSQLLFGLSFLCMFTGVGWYAAEVHLKSRNEIQNNGIWFSSLTSRGLAAWVLGLILTTFYIILYWFPSLLGFGEGVSNTGFIAFFDPLSQFLKGQPASQWFVYGTLYTFAILVFGFKFLLKYRHSRYQIIRTCSVIFFQFGFAWLIPELLMRLQYPFYDMKNMWPLNYYAFDEWSVQEMINSGVPGLFMIIFGIVMIFIISPVLTYFYGKRWYCSWVCGCGGLAETAGDPFRHLSDTSDRSWKIERWSVHLVLLFATIMTIGVVYSYLDSGQHVYWISSDVFFYVSAFVLFIPILIISFGAEKLLSGLSPGMKSTISSILFVMITIMLWNHLTGNTNLFFIDNQSLRAWYGFLIGAAFSGVIGVGFYPIFGSRVWCRFGCPMAAILGVQQKFFSKFRITTNGSQCISCGNCSTYCEMGIDVRSYAEQGQDIIRASCVGCGICSEVCPRGVLRLENGIGVQERGLEKRAIHISFEDVGRLEEG